LARERGPILDGRPCYSGRVLSRLRRCLCVLGTTAVSLSRSPSPSSREKAREHRRTVRAASADNTSVPVRSSRDMSSQICLKWNSFLSNIATSFESLWEEEGLVDVTLASDGQCLTAHKVILSASSPFFKKVFQVSPSRSPSWSSPNIRVRRRDQSSLDATSPLVRDLFSRFARVLSCLRQQAGKTNDAHLITVA